MSASTPGIGRDPVQTDETVVKQLAPGHGPAKQCYLWTLNQHGRHAVFVWRTSRAAQCLRDATPADFTRVIGCDAPMDAGIEAAT